MKRCVSKFTHFQTPNSPNFPPFTSPIFHPCSPVLDVLLELVRNCTKTNEIILEICGEKNSSKSLLFFNPRKACQFVNWPANFLRRSIGAAIVPELSPVFATRGADVEIIPFSVSSSEITFFRSFFADFHVFFSIFAPIFHVNNGNKVCLWRFSRISSKNFMVKWEKVLSPVA